MLRSKYLLLLCLLVLLPACAEQLPAASPSPETPARQATFTQAQPVRQSTETPRPVETAKPTPTPIPTRTPLPTPVPLDRNAVAGCPVSLPNIAESPDPYYISVKAGYSNPDRTMFISLWPGGKVFLHPDGPGSQHRDGSLGMKFWFYRTIPGEVLFEGRRLDQPGPAAHMATLRGPLDGYGETGFHPAGLDFPSQGCWEVTASIGDASMTFVTLVVWVPFKPLLPGWLPEGVIATDSDLTAYPETFTYVYRFPDGGEIAVATTQGDREEPYPDEAQQEITLNGRPANCVQGMWDGQQWDAEADVGALIWSVQRLSYRISQMGLGLSCRDLRRVAQSS